jgi:hypothetical protein
MQTIDMKVSLFVFFSFLIFYCCTTSHFKEKQASSLPYPDSIYGSLVADTIIYDVLIHTTNPNDQWAQHYLQSVNQRMLIDSLFNLVYDGKVIAYDFFEKKPLSIKAIKKLEEEPGYSRDHIGKIQFTEKWYFDASSVHFRKEVISIVLGYDLFDNEGNIRGHKPVFKLNLNH